MAQKTRVSGGAPIGGEMEGRRRGERASGGIPTDRPLEDGQLRGVNEEGQITRGMHGGPLHVHPHGKKRSK